MRHASYVALRSLQVGPESVLVWWDPVINYALPWHRAALARTGLVPASHEMARYGPPHIARENLRSNSEKHQKPRFRDFEEKKIKNVLKNAGKVLETKPTLSKVWLYKQTTTALIWKWLSSHWAEDWTTEVGTRHLLFSSVSKVVNLFRMTDWGLNLTKRF